MCAKTSVNESQKKMSPDLASRSPHARRANTSAAPKATPIEHKRTLCHQPEGRNLGVAPLKGM